MTKEQMLNRRIRQLEAIRKDFSGKPRFASRGLAVVKCRHRPGRCESSEHQVDRADTQHRSAGVRPTFVVFAVATIPPQPSERALHHPPLGHGYKPAGSFWPGLDFQVPMVAVFFQPPIQFVIAILLVPPECGQPRAVFLVELDEDLGRGPRGRPRRRVGRLQALGHLGPHRRHGGLHCRPQHRRRLEHLTQPDIRGSLPVLVLGREASRLHLRPRRQP